MTTLGGYTCDQGQHIPPEIVLMIVKWARAGNKYDYNTLCSLSLVSKMFWTVMRENREVIIKYYTVTRKFRHTVQTILYGSPHSIDDKPAIMQHGGIECIWFKHGQIHRDNDLPAIIRNDGSMEWYCNGDLHRDNDLPAKIYADESVTWYQHGEIHRDNDRPAIMRANGTRIWYQRGKRHRTAIGFGGAIQPAVIYADGQRPEWWHEGRRVH